jgi:hypothetical protein
LYIQISTTNVMSMEACHRTLICEGGSTIKSVTRYLLILESQIGWARSTICIIIGRMWLKQYPAPYTRTERLRTHTLLTHVQRVWTQCSNVIQGVRENRLLKCENRDEVQYWMKEVELNTCSCSSLWVRFCTASRILRRTVPES